MMKQNMRRFAPIGLYLAGIALLAAGGLYIVLQEFSLPVQISLGVIVLGLALFVMLDPQRTREALTGRQARHGSNALLLTIAFTGIIIVVNYLVANNSKRWDLSEDQTNTLTQETLDALASLQEPVKVEAYYTSGASIEQANNLLQNYDLNGGSKFDFEFIDPNTDPVRAEAAGITRDATLVVRMGDRTEMLNFPSEEDLTGAIIRLSNPGDRTVYFLTGHGEFAIEGSTERSYSPLVEKLKAKNYTAKSLNLLAEGAIPEDAKALVIPGPDKPLSQEEVNQISTYLNNGGSLIYLTEPRPLTQFGDQPDPLAEYLAQAWSIQLGENLVIDFTSNQQGLAVSQNYGESPITRKMMSQVIILPGARTVNAGAAAEGVSLTELAFTSERSWAESDFESLLGTGDITQGEGDTPGPLTLAVSGANSGTNGRVVVIGDADFAGSQAFNSYGNSDFIMNSIDWAAEQENMISLTPRQPTQRVLVPPTTTVLGLILLGSVFLLPALVLMTGVSVWIQRRRRG